MQPFKLMYKIISLIMHEENYVEAMAICMHESDKQITLI